MTNNDIMRIRSRLKIMWKDIMPDDAATKVWLDSFRRYEFDIIEKACISYMQSGRFKPTPADILMCIPAVRAEEVKAKAVPAVYVTLPDGRQARAFRCQRCRDTGLVTWEGEDLCMYGRPCTCDAAIANFGSEVRAKAYGYGQGGQKNELDQSRQDSQRKRNDKHLRSGWDRVDD